MWELMIINGKYSFTLVRDIIYGTKVEIKQNKKKTKNKIFKFPCCFFCFVLHNQNKGTKVLYKGISTSCEH